MSLHRIRSLPQVPAPTSALEARVARIVEIVDGRPFVDVEGQRVAARVALEGCPVNDEAAWLHTPVLLLFDNADPRLPVIVGLVNDRLPSLAMPSGRPDDFEIEGRRIAFEGHEEVVLRCGEASITLRADGQIVLKGTRLTSRASETNKIRGATVQIN